MLRLIDVVLSALGLMVGLPLMLVITLLGFLETGSPFFRQVRVGRHQRSFVLVKFRSMKLETQAMATHLVNPVAVTQFGGLLRRSKLDELPQLWNVLKGEMSLVGPRPCLFNQDELIAEREARGVFNARPGITGLAQVNCIDMSTPALLAETDAKMLRDLSLNAYFKYIGMTALGKGAGDRVKTGK